MTFKHTKEKPTEKIKHARSVAIDEVGLIAALTLVLWAMALLVGIAGLVWGSPHKQTSPNEPESPVAMLEVDLTEAPPQFVQAMASQQPALQATESRTTAPPAAPVVALPSPQIAFAPPVEEPVPVVAARPASPAHSIRAAQNTEPAVQQLVFGNGEPQQPLPEYPIEAALAGEEGTVEVVFIVEPDGSVAGVQLIAPCKWGLLNNAAMRAVRTTWHFNPGPVRRYRYSIQFVHVH